MSIIDRYLIINFLKSFVVFFITFAGLYMVIDAFSNLEEFITAGEQQGGVLAVVIRYYGLRSLALFDRTSGVLLLVAGMFTVTMLARNNELTAMMAAGISKGRAVKPLISVVIVLCILGAANRELVLPKFRQELAMDANDLRQDTGREISPRYDNRSDILLGGHRAYLLKQRIDQPSFILPAHLQGLGTRLAATEAIYHEATPDRPAGYWLKGVTQPTPLAGVNSLVTDEQTYVYLPNDTPWLGSDEIYVPSELRIEHLAGGRGWSQYAATAEMISALHSPATEYGDDVKVAVHVRFVKPLLDVTLLFLGLPLVLSRQSRNVFVSIGLCLAIVVGYYVVVLACRSLGGSGMISPALAVWAPLMVFVPLAVVLCEPLRAASASGSS